MELNNIDKKPHMSDIINSNLVDGKLDEECVLQQIFDEECAKTILKTIIHDNVGNNEKEVG